MGDNTGIRSPGFKQQGYRGTDGQHRQPPGGPSGDATGIRSVPRGYDVGQERGGDQQMDVPLTNPRADVSTEGRENPAIDYDNDRD